MKTNITSGYSTIVYPKRYRGVRIFINGDVFNLIELIDHIGEQDSFFNPKNKTCIVKIGHWKK